MQMCRSNHVEYLYESVVLETLLKYFCSVSVSITLCQNFHGIYLTLQLDGVSVHVDI